MNLILINGRGSLREREAVERALYGGWSIIRWDACGENFVGLLSSEGVDPQYQVGRLQSFGTWGVRLDPSATDTFDVFHRLLGS